MRKEYSLVDEMPFDFSRRRMSVVVADTTGKTQIITKGALEEMLTVCSYAEYHGQVEPLTPELQAEILERVRRYNNDGMVVYSTLYRLTPLAASGYCILKLLNAATSDVRILFSRSTL